MAISGIHAADFSATTLGASVASALFARNK
jgi:hypothetical protein